MRVIQSYCEESIVPANYVREKIDRFRKTNPVRHFFRVSLRLVNKRKKSTTVAIIGMYVFNTRVCV